MDNNITRVEKQVQDMENWKKQILMDPVLSSLLDHSSQEDFLVSKILPLSKTQIASIYSKLSTINFELSHNMQKQVQAKSHYIQKAYLQLLAYKQQSGDQSHIAISKNKPAQCLNYLKNFNKKYEKIEESVNIWKNITHVLHYSKGLQSFRVNANILKTLMRGYNGSEETINPIKVAKMLRELIYISMRFDFNGLKAFENQRVFITNTKIVINSIGIKNIPKLLQQYTTTTADQSEKKTFLQKQIIEWINALSNLGTLKEFIGNYFKAIQTQLSQKTKKTFQPNLVNIQSNLTNILIPFILQTSISLVLLQEKLVTLKKIELTNLANMFIKFWQKMCEVVTETIVWIKKDQQAKNLPKTREAAIVWKYPLLYTNFASLTSDVEVYMLENAIFNTYSFAKNKQRLMVGCLLELSVQYHEQVNKLIQQMSQLFGSICLTKNTQNNLEQRKQSEQLVSNYLQKVKILLCEAKCTAVFDSLLKNLTKKLKAVQNKLYGSQQTNQSEQLKQDRKTLNLLKRKLKQLLKQFSGIYGISRQQLQAFKQQRIN